MAACSLEVFDLIHNSEISVCAEDLASRLKTDADTLERLLNACCALGLLQKETDNNGIGEQLVYHEEFTFRGLPSHTFIHIHL